MAVSMLLRTSRMLHAGLYLLASLYVDSRERTAFVENSSYTVVDRGFLIQQGLRALK